MLVQVTGYWHRYQATKKRTMVSTRVVRPFSLLVCSSSKGEMLCVVLGLVPPNETVAAQVESKITTLGDDDDHYFVEWRGRSHISDTSVDPIAPTLLLSAVITTPGEEQQQGAAIDTLLLQAAQKVADDASSHDTNDDADTARDCNSVVVEVWASAPAPLPLRPENGYQDVLVNNILPLDGDDWTTRAARALREWGLMLQPKLLQSNDMVNELRSHIDEAIAHVEQSLATHRPHLVVGQDQLLFREIASRSQQRFDLRLPNDSPAADWIQTHIVSQPAVVALLERSMECNMSELDFDASVVYSKPGADAQGWHADGQHHQGGEDAGWQANGWQTQLASPYAVCLFIPLIDLNQDVGYTQFWPGSHRNSNWMGFGRLAEVTSSTFDAVCNAGDALWYDYRLFHRGMPNISSNVLRPIVQVIFKKKWYIEKANYGTEPIATEPERTNS